MSIPQRIKQLANQVRNAVYGKDVREAIAESMEVTGQTAEEAKERSLEQLDRVDKLIQENPQPSEVVDARGNFPILRDRLNSIDSDLAQTSKNQRGSFTDFKIKPPIETIAYFDTAETIGPRIEELYKDKNTFSVRKIKPENPTSIQFTPEFPVVSKGSPVSLGFELECNDWKKITSIVIRVYPSDGETRFSRTFSVDKSFGGKSRRIRTTATRSGDGLWTGNLDTSGRIEMDVYGDEGLEMTFRNSIYIYRKNPFVAIQFDDGLRSVYELAMPILKERGIPATFNVITDSITDPSKTEFCNWSELEELQNLGWTIGNHTTGAINFQTAPIPEVVAAVEGGRNALSSRGFTGSDVLVAHQNSLDSRTLPYVKHLAKSFKYGNSHATNYDDLGGPIGVGFLNRARSVLNTDDVNDLLQEYDDRTERTAFMSYCFHGLTTSQNPSTFYYNIDKFEQFIDGLLSRGATFVTIEELADAFLNE